MTGDWGSTARVLESRHWAVCLHGRGEWLAFVSTHWISALPVLAWLWLVVLTVAGLLGFEVRRPSFEAGGLALGTGVLVAAIAGAVRCGATTVAHLATPRYVWLTPAIAALGAFGWALTLGPLSDDFVLREWAVDGQWLPESWPFVRPLPLAMWQALIAAGGDWWLLHAVNLVAHALNSALVARVGARWSGPRAGVAAGLLFACFPASTEAVGWSAGVFDLLATTAVLLSVSLWEQAAPSPRRTAAIVLLCVAGMLCKESALVIPALLALITITSATTFKEARTRMRSLSLPAAVTVVFVVARALSSAAVTTHLSSVPASRREWKDLLVRPFSGVALPVRGDEGELLALLVLILVGVALARALRPPGVSEVGMAPPGTVLVVGSGWILIAAMPLLMTFFVSSTLEGSRYLYLSSAGFALALSSAPTGRSVLSRVVAPAALVAILAFYGARVNEERQIWQSAAALRDSLLSQASQIAETVPCRTLTIANAPDNVSGAYVFRVGLDIAIAAVPKNPDGGPCSLRWNGSTLEPQSPAPSP